MTDSPADAATRPATGLMARLRLRAAGSAPYAAALLALVGRAISATTSPALSAWFQPSLRRRLGASLAVMSLTGFIVVSGSLLTVDNLFLHPGYYGCGGVQSVFPALPAPKAAAPTTGRRTCSAWSS